MSTTYAQAKRVENLHLTRERDRRRGRELATFLLAGLPVACALLGFAALHIETVRVGYIREARQRTISELTEENRRLRAELGRASSPERVAAIAKAKGLRAPHPGQVQYVEAAGSEPAVAAPGAPSRETPR
jgi:cell division protein FtsL